MSIDDPRYKIRTLLSASITDANLTRDDDATELTWISFYAPYTIPLPKIFLEKNVDLIFTVADAEHVETTLGVSHVAEHVVTIYAIDKYSGGTKIITASLVLWKATKELRSVFKENPWGSLRSFVEDHIETEDVGTTIIWGKPCRIQYKTYSA